MDKSEQHEGKNLRKIILEKYQDLDNAARQLGYNYSYLSSVFGKQKLNPKFKKRISKLLNVGMAAIEDSSGLSHVAEPPPPEYAVGSKWQDLAQEESRLRAEIARLEGEAAQMLRRLADKDKTIEDLLALLRNRKE